MTCEEARRDRSSDLGNAPYHQDDDCDDIGDHDDLSRSSDLGNAPWHQEDDDIGDYDDL